MLPSGRSSRLRNVACPVAAPRLRITEARRPLRGADDIAIRTDDLKKVELRILRHGLRLGQIRRGVAGLHELEGHAARALARGEAIDGGGDLGRAMLKLALKLADEERRLFLVALLEHLANAHQHRPRHRSHRRRDGERKEQQQLLAQAHGASSSETPARSGVPSARSCRSRTRRSTA